MPSRSQLKKAWKRRGKKTRGVKKATAPVAVRVVAPPKTKRSKRQISFIPNSMATVHRYSHQNDWALTSGSTTNQYFYGNSLSHCYNNTAGEQAYGFDQFGALYKKYYVYKAVCTLTVVPNTEMANVVVGIITDMDMNTTPTFTGFYDVVEKCQKWRFIPKTPTKPIVLSITKFTKAMNIKNDDNGQGNYDATTPVAPSDKWGFRIVCFNNGSATSDIKAYATIRYYARWYEPQEQAGSS